MHAFIYSDGYSVQARIGDSTAGFPFLKKREGNNTAWSDAAAWATIHGATSIEFRS